MPAKYEQLLLWFSEGVFGTVIYIKSFYFYSPWKKKSQKMFGFRVISETIEVKAINYFQLKVPEAALQRCS